MTYNEVKVAKGIGSWVLSNEINSPLFFILSAAEESAKIYFRQIPRSLGVETC